MEFIGVDGEGITGPCDDPGCICGDFLGQTWCRRCGHHKDGHRHVYVLLGVGNDQFAEQLADPHGVDHWRIFAFLYDVFPQPRPHAAFVAYFDDYDLAQTVKWLPEHSAWLLVTDAGKRARTPMWTRSDDARQPWPVRVCPHIRAKGDRPCPTCIGAGAAWELEYLPGRQLSLRPMSCDCALTKGAKCRHRKQAYLHLNDAGSFFQASLLSIIHPDNWPDDPVCRPEEYQLIERGKGLRPDAKLDDDMRVYRLRVELGSVT